MTSNEQYEKEDAQIGLLDQLRYAPTREQWQQEKENAKGEVHFRGPYRARRFYAIFGISTPRWDDLVRENKKKT